MSHVDVGNGVLGLLSSWLYAPDLLPANATRHYDAGRLTEGSGSQQHGLTSPHASQSPRIKPGARERQRLRLAHYQAQQQQQQHLQQHPQQHTKTVAHHEPCPPATPDSTVRTAPMPISPITPPSSVPTFALHPPATNTCRLATQDAASQTPDHSTHAAPADELAQTLENALHLLQTLQPELSAAQHEPSSSSSSQQQQQGWHERLQRLLAHPLVQQRLQQGGEQQQVWQLNLLAMQPLEEQEADAEQEQQQDQQQRGGGEEQQQVWHSNLLAMQPPLEQEEEQEDDAEAVQEQQEHQEQQHHQEQQQQLGQLGAALLSFTDEESKLVSAECEALKEQVLSLSEDLLHAQQEVDSRASASDQLQQVLCSLDNSLSELYTEHMHTKQALAAAQTENAQMRQALRLEYVPPGTLGRSSTPLTAEV